jgi:hypothetical protein
MRGAFPFGFAQAKDDKHRASRLLSLLGDGVELGDVAELLVTLFE